MVQKKLFSPMSNKINSLRFVQLWANVPDKKLFDAPNQFNFFKFENCGGIRPPRFAALISRYTKFFNSVNWGGIVPCKGFPPIDNSFSCGTTLMFCHIVPVKLLLLR